MSSHHTAMMTYAARVFEDEENFPMPEDVYKGVDIIEHAYNFYKINGDKFVNADEESRKSALVEYALPLNIDGLEKDLAKYRIVYDTCVQRKFASQERCGKADR